MGDIGGISFEMDNIASMTGIVLFGILCYIAGRLHQHYRTTEERDLAYREGYNTATRALFSLATRATRGIEAPPLMEVRREVPSPRPTPIKGSAKVGGKIPAKVGGRHSAGDQKSTMQQTNVLNPWEKSHSV